MEAAPGTTWECLLDTLAAHRHRAHIAGPHGSGKTTLLDALATPAMLAAFIRRLAHDFPITPDEVHRLHADTRGNLREALWRCYDRAGDLTGSDWRPNPVRSWQWPRCGSECGVRRQESSASGDILPAAPPSNGAVISDRRIFRATNPAFCL